MTDSNDSVVEMSTQPSRAHAWAVDSPAILSGLVPRPCGDGLRATEPPPCASPLAVTISGGGFRATLAGVGVLQLLGEANLLANLRYLSSVSGGSVANALLAVAWPQIRDEAYTADSVASHVIDPLVDRVSRQSLKWSLVRGAWRTIGPRSRTHLLARRLDEWWLNGCELASLDPEVRWIVNAANLVTGVRFAFERDVLGDYTLGLLSTRDTHITLSTAVAASAAVPGAFAPLVLHGLNFPCSQWDPVLMDGGTYDNTGLQALTSERYKDAFLVTMNAGGLLRPGPYGKVPILRDLARANSLLYRQSTGLRTSDLVERFQRGRAAGDGPLPVDARRGFLIALATTLPYPGPPRLQEWRARFGEWRDHDGQDLSLVPTVFDKLDERLCRALIYRGWWLAGASLALHHPDRLPDFSSWSAPER